MLQSMGSKRVGRDLASEQQHLLSECLIVGGRAIREKGSFLYSAKRAPCGVLLKKDA